MMAELNNKIEFEASGWSYKLELHDNGQIYIYDTTDTGNRHNISELAGRNYVIFKSFFEKLDKAVIDLQNKVKDPIAQPINVPRRRRRLVL